MLSLLLLFCFCRSFLRTPPSFRPGPICMPASRLRLITVAVVISTLSMLVAGVWAGLCRLEDHWRERIAAALGPYGSADEIRLGFSGITLEQLRIGHPERPAADVLTARRVLLSPDYSDLLFGRFTLERVRIEGGQVSLRRLVEGWDLPLPDPTTPAETLSLPSPAPVATGSERTAKPDAEKSGRTSLRIKRLEMVDSSLELSDFVVTRPTHRIELENLDLKLAPLQLPDLGDKTHLTLTATVGDAPAAGSANSASSVFLDGYFVPREREYGFQLRLRHVELAAIQPYIARGRLPFASGRIDLEINADCRDNRLRAPGNLALYDLKLGGSGAERLSSAQRFAAQLALRESNGRLSTRFNAEGRCDEPLLSLDYNPQSRLAKALFRSLDLSLDELARALGAEHRH